jgi:hypothetical protein
MTSADAMRASDGDRERVVQALQEQVGEGRLTLVEFEERSRTAYAAKTIADLRALTTDLPIDPLGPHPQQQAPWQGPFAMPEIPPWAQRAMQQQDANRSPVRRLGPLGTIAAVLIMILLVQGVIGAVFLGAHFVFPLLPLFFVLFILFNRGTRRRYR